MMTQRKSIRVVVVDIASVLSVSPVAAGRGRNAKGTKLVKNVDAAAAMLPYVL